MIKILKWHPGSLSWHTSALQTKLKSKRCDCHTQVLICVFFPVMANVLLIFSLFGEQWSPILAAGAAAFKNSHPPPETNGSIGHTLVDWGVCVCVCVCVSLSDGATCRGNDLPSDLMAKTACLKREKHVILIMNVKGFTACFGWGDRNWGIITCLHRIAFFLRVWMNFKWRWVGGKISRGKNGSKMGTHRNMREWGVGCTNLYSHVPLKFVETTRTLVLTLTPRPSFYRIYTHVNAVKRPFHNIKTNGN